MRRKMHHGGGGGQRNNNGGGGEGGRGGNGGGNNAGRRRFVRKPGGGGGGGGNRFHHDDSDAVNPRMRKQAQTNQEKYQMLGRNALSSGDRVEAEYYFQHADHYLRIINQIDAQFTPRQQTPVAGDTPADGEGREGENTGTNEEAYTGTDIAEEPEEDFGGASLASVLPAPKMGAGE